MQFVPVATVAAVAPPGVCGGTISPRPLSIVVVVCVCVSKLPCVLSGEVCNSCTDGGE